MFALVQDGNITQMPKGNKGITIDGNQYPASIYTLWTEAERNAIGIVTGKHITPMIMLSFDFYQLQGIYYHCI